MTEKFDLAALDTKTLSEQGMPMPIIHPRTRTPIMNEDGTPLTITLLGRHSEAFRETLRASQQGRADLTARGIAISDEHREREDINTLVACTRDWTFQVLDGKEFPCTPQNVRKLWNDTRFRGLRETAIGFILSDGNFLRDLPGSSADMPDTSSSSAVAFPRAVPSEMSSGTTG